MGTVFFLGRVGYYRWWREQDEDCIGLERLLDNGLIMGQVIEVSERNVRHP